MRDYIWRYPRGSYIQERWFDLGNPGLNSRGITLDHLERCEEALADFNRVLELRPDYPDTLSNRGATMAHLERYDEVLADHNRSLVLRPDAPNTQYNIACLFSLTGRYEEAMRWLDRSIIGDSKYRQLATEDEDLASLRDLPEFGPQFHQLVTGNPGLGETTSQPPSASRRLIYAAASRRPSPICLFRSGWRSGAPSFPALPSRSILIVDKPSP